MKLACLKDTSFGPFLHKQQGFLRIQVQAPVVHSGLTQYRDYQLLIHHQQVSIFVFDVECYICCVTCIMKPSFMPVSVYAAQGTGPQKGGNILDELTQDYTFSLPCTKE